MIVSEKYLGKLFVGCQVLLAVLVCAFCFVSCAYSSDRDMTSLEEMSGQSAVVKNEESFFYNEKITNAEVSCEITAQCDVTDEKTIETEICPATDIADYKGLIFSSVYGNGGKSDAAAEHSFIQLYNMTDKDLSLYGLSLYYKTSGAEPFSQFPFSKDAVISAGEYYLVRCRAALRYELEHAIFSIENYDAEWDVEIDNKEISLLLAPAGKAIPKDTDIATYAYAVDRFAAVESRSFSNAMCVVENMSKNKVAVRTALTNYSGYHKASLDELSTTELLRVCPRASAGLENAVVASRLNEVYFSSPAGIYTETVSLELMAKEGYDIYITTDGSDPRKYGKLYKEALILRNSSNMIWSASDGHVISTYSRGNPKTNRLIGGYVIKAYATDGNESTGVYTSTYFVADKLTKLGATVMSISMDTRDIVGRNGFYRNYDDGDLDTSRPRGLGMLEVFDSDGTRVGYSNVEMAVSGHASAGWAKKSLRIYYKGANNKGAGALSELDYDLFDGEALDSNGNAITNFSRLLLRNSGNDRANSLVRDAFMQSVSADLCVDTMSSEAVLVFINGDFWGVYNARERYSGEYVESHYGVDKDDVVILENDYKYAGQENKRREPYIVSSGDKMGAGDFNDLFKYVREHDLSDVNNYEYVCSKIDIDSFIDMYCVRLYFDASDWPENNIKIWRNTGSDDFPGSDTKWHFTLLDLDFGLGMANDHTCDHFAWAFGNSNSVCGDLAAALIKNPEFKELFIARYYQIVREVFDTDRLLAEFDKWRDEYSKLIPYEVKRWGAEGVSLAIWENEMRDIRSFIENRNYYALQSMYDYFDISESYAASILYNITTVRFDSEHATVTVNGEPADNGESFQFDDLQKYRIEIEVAEGYELSSVTLAYRDGMVSTYYDNVINIVADSSVLVSILVRPIFDITKDPYVESGIFAGPSYMFYLDPSGNLYAWGNNENYVLGIGAILGMVSSPIFVMGNVRKVATSKGTLTGGSMTAVLSLDGNLYTVGSNDKGQLARNGRLPSDLLDRVRFDGNIVDVSVGYDHMLILDDRGDMYGVGSNSYGQLGTKKKGAYSTSFIKIASNVQSCSAGYNNTYYITTDGELYGLGDNRWRKLDTSDIKKLSRPVHIASEIVGVYAGKDQAMVVDRDGKLYYIGRRVFGTLEEGGGNDPVLIKVADGVKKADMYSSDLAFLGEDGNAYVYGLNTNGAIGSAVLGTDPVKIFDGIADIASGHGFTAYLTVDGRILVRGDDSCGQSGCGGISNVDGIYEIDIFA